MFEESVPVGLLVSQSHLQNHAVVSEGRRRGSEAQWSGASVSVDTLLPSVGRTREPHRVFIDIRDFFWRNTPSGRCGTLYLYIVPSDNVDTFVYGGDRE